jgi:hypothetical protein
MLFLKQGQVLYKEEDEDPTIYVPVFGKIKIWNKKLGQIGTVGLGQTLGEECLIDKSFICRLDNCYAEQETGLICIDMHLFQALRIGPPKEVLKDFNTFEILLRRNYFTKKTWRSSSPNAPKKTLHSLL